MHCPFYFNISSSFLSSFYHAVFLTAYPTWVSGGAWILLQLKLDYNANNLLFFSFFLPFILIVYTLIIFLFILFDCIGPGQLFIFQKITFFKITFDLTKISLHVGSQSFKIIHRIHPAVLSDYISKTLPLVVNHLQN